MTEEELQEEVNKYGGHVEKCTVKDEKKECVVDFEDKGKAEDAVKDANAGKINGAESAAMGAADDTDGDKSPDDGPSMIPIIAGIAGGVLVLAVIAGVVIYKVRKSNDVYLDDEQCASMNMAMDDVSPTGVGNV